MKKTILTLNLLLSSIALGSDNKDEKVSGPYCVTMSEPSSSNTNSSSLSQSNCIATLNSESNYFKPASLSLMAAKREEIRNKNNQELKKCDIRRRLEILDSDNYDTYVYLNLDTTEVRSSDYLNYNEWRYLPDMTERCSPDGRYIVTGGVSGGSRETRLWNATDPNKITYIRELYGHFKYIYIYDNSVEFSPDGKYLAIISFDRTVILWDITNPNNITYIELNGNFCEVKFSTNSKYLITGSRDEEERLWSEDIAPDKTAKLWDITNPKSITYMELKGHGSTIGVVKFTPDFKYVVTTEDKTARFWNITDPNNVTSKGFKDNSDKIISDWIWAVKFSSEVAFSSDDKSIVTTGLLGKPDRIWNITDPNKTISKIAFVEFNVSTPLTSEQPTLSSTSLLRLRRVTPRQSKDSSLKSSIKEITKDTKNKVKIL